MQNLNPPPEIPPELKQAMEQGVQIPGIGIAKNGGADPRARGLMLMQQQSPSVAAHNAYMQELAKNTMGYVTFLGSIAKLPGGMEVAETAHQYKSANGDVRLLLRFISAPVYFKADWDYFAAEAKKRNPTFVVSEKILDQARLERRSELQNKSISFEELVNVAKTLQVKDGPTLTRDILIEKILDIEFK